jgi:hypothetical protein
MRSRSQACASASAADSRERVELHPRSSWRADGFTEDDHDKDDRYGPGPVGAVVTPDAIRSTLRLVPR